LKTKAIKDFPTDIPTVHNPEERFYIQPLADHSVLIGGFLRQAKPIFSDGVPDTFHFSLLPDNWDDFRELVLFNESYIINYSIDWILSNAIKRFPILAESECETLITGADSYTPDGRLIMNESAEVSH
jgi:4-methylaminobutanoate oxidase (formaldehyde-forming)